MSERLKLKLMGRSVLKGKIGAHFPADVNAASPLVLTQVGSDYSFSLDVDALEDILGTASGVADGDKGDITASGGGLVWTIDPNVVTYAKMQDVSAASRLLGRGDSGAGDPQEITLGTNLTMSGTTLNVSGGGSGDVVGPASATDNAIARFDTATGKLIQNSGVTISDANAIAGAASITVGNTGLVVGASTPFSDAAGVLTLQNVDALDPTTEATIETAIDTLANLTSVGTITTGVWNGTDIAFANIAQGAARSVLGVTGNATADLAPIQSSATGQVLNSTATTVVWTATPTVTSLTVGNTGLIVGASTPFSDAAGVLTLQNVDALDPTTEATIEAAIDTLANLTSAANLATVGTITTGVWNGTDIAYANIVPATAISRLLGRGAAAGAGDWQEITLGANLTMTGTVLAASSGTATVGDGDYGDIVVSGTGTVWTIDVNVVTYAKMQDVSAASRLLGRGDSGAGDPQEITLGAGLTMTGTVLASSGGYTDEQAQDAIGTILVDSTRIDFTYNDATPSITADILVNSVDNTFLADMVAATVKGRAVGAGTGDPTDLTGAQVLAIIEATTPLVSTAEGNAAYQPLDATLTSLAAFNTNGILTQTAADTFAGRTITGTASRLAVTNGSGSAGNPTLDIDAAYVGQSTIATLGTVTTGVWNGTDIAFANIAQVSAVSRLLGRGDAGAPGDIQEITLGTNLTMSGTTLNASGGGGSQTPWTSNIDANLFNLLFDDNTGILDESANEQLIFQTTASAVNFWQMTNSAANGVQRLEAAGADASIAITFASKGTDPINFEINGANEAILSQTAFTPGSDGGSSLGSLTLNWQDLFLNAAANININNDWIATHATGILTVGTGDLRVTNNFTNAASVVTVGGAQTLTNKSLTTPTITGSPTASGATWANLGTVTEGTFANTGLHLLDTNASHDLIIAPGSNITADRTLTITTGDASVTLNLTAVTDEFVLAYDVGTNTWRGVAPGGGGSQTPWTSNIDANTFSLLFDDNTGILDESGNEQLIFQTTASAVNFWQMTNSAANGVQRLEAAGTDTNIAVTLASKGTDPINFEIDGATKAILSTGVIAAFTPATAGGAQLGTPAALTWQALWLNAGGTLNIGGDWAITHFSGVGTVTGDLRVTTVGANAASVVTNAGTATLTNKTLDANGTGNSITNIETPDIAAAALVTAADTIATNDNDTSWPTTAAVIDYVAAVAGSKTRTITAILNGAGATLTTGIKGDLEIPFACTITQVTMLADQSGSIAVDIWKDTFANFPPVAGDSITASAKPTISSSTKSQDSTLSGWNTSIAAGDILRFNVETSPTPTNIQRLTLSLRVTA